MLSVRSSMDLTEAIYFNDVRDDIDKKHLCHMT